MIMGTEGATTETQRHKGLCLCVSVVAPSIPRIPAPRLLRRWPLRSRRFRDVPSFFIGDLDAAEYEWCRRSQAMQVKADADAELQWADFSSSRKTRARVRSVGRVILIFRSEPRTMATG